MPINFPRLNFDWLGQIPENIEEARGRESLRSLGDLDITSAEGLDKAARQLFATKNLTNMQLALRLTQLAQNRRALESREKMVDPSQWGEILSGLSRREEPALPQPGQGTPEPELEPEVDPDTGDVRLTPRPRQAPAEAPPATLPGMPATPGPGIPGITAPSARPGAALSPSEELLGRTQAALEPQPGTPLPPTRLAQLAGEVPGIPEIQPARPAPFAPTAPVPYLPPAAAPAAPRPAAPPPRPPVSLGDASRAAAREEARKIEAITPFLSQAPAGVQAIINRRYERALRAADYGPEEDRYRADQFQRAARGLPIQTRPEWASEEKRMPERDKAAEERYAGKGGYRELGDKAVETRTTIDQMKALMARPDFKSGMGIEGLSKLGSGITAMIDLAKFYGVTNLPGNDWIQKNISNPTAVAQMFAALSNRVVFATLGSLGNQISEGDRGFITRAFNSLSMTPQGNAALLEHMEAIAKRNQVVERIARTYMKERKGRADQIEMDDVVRKYADKHPLFIGKDGTLTDAGKKVDRALSGGYGIPAPEGQPAPLAPSPQRQGGATAPRRTKSGVEWSFD